MYSGVGGGLGGVSEAKPSREAPAKRALRERGAQRPARESWVSEQGERTKVRTSKRRCLDVYLVLYCNLSSASLPSSSR